MRLVTAEPRPVGTRRMLPTRFECLTLTTLLRDFQALPLPATRLFRPFLIAYSKTLSRDRDLTGEKAHLSGRSPALFA